MSMHNKNTSLFLNALKIAGALALSCVLYAAVFMGIFDFTISLLELIAAAMLSVYGIAETVNALVPHRSRKKSALRVFLAVFFSCLLIYVIGILLFMSLKDIEKDDISVPVESNVYVETPSSNDSNTEHVEDIPRKDNDKWPLSAEPSTNAEPISTPGKAASQSASAMQPTPTTIESADAGTTNEVVAVSKAIATPDAPLFIGEPSYALINSLRVPDIPTFTSLDRAISEPLSSSPIVIRGSFDAQDDEWVEGEWASEDFSDDDFWADFYIAGEEDLILEDGIYYFDLYINGNVIGTMTVLFENGKISLLAADLKEAVDGYITEEANARIFRGEEYLSEETLEERGVDIEINADEYKVYAIFSPEDMPIERISIRGGRSSRASRTIAGAEILEPAVFTLLTRYSLSSSFTILPTASFEKSITASLSAANTFRLYDVNGSFNLGLRYINDEISFSMNSLYFYVTMPEKLMRISWGNVSTDLLYAAGTSLGVRVDKSLSYAEDGYKRPSHIEKTITVEKDSDVQILNEGKEIFKKTLSAGKYSLNDFILYSGANRIKIIITPLDGSPATELDIDINYSSSLLAPGEFFYGAAFATGMNKVSSDIQKADTALRMPWFNNYSYDFDARNIALSFYIKAGISKTLTMNSTFALSNALSDVSWFMPKFKSSNEFTHANRFGAARYNLNLGTSKYTDRDFTLPSIYFKVGQQFATNIRALSSISLSGSYTLSEQKTFEEWGSANLSLGLSGSLGLISWAFNGNVTTPLKTYKDTTWSVSSSLSTTLSKHFSLSASGSIYSSSSNSIAYTGRVSATITFSPVRTTVSYSNSGFSATSSASSGRNTVNMQFDASRITDKDTYSASADYSYSGKYVGVNTRVSAPTGLNSLNGSLTLTASSVFADGLFTFSQSIPSNFVLIKQKGILRGNEVTVGSLGTTTPEKIPMIFGVGLYKGIPSNGNTSFSVFSASKSSLGTASSFNYSLPESRRGGYVLRLRAESSYSAAGYARLEDGSCWVNGSSPLYSVEIVDNEIILNPSDEYLFTDSEGLFILSGIKAGLWAFDAEIDGIWYLYIIDIKEDEKHVLDMNLFNACHKADGYSVAGPYSAVYEFDEGEYMTGDEFWDRIYLSEEVL